VTEKQYFLYKIGKKQHAGCVRWRGI